tara:strand:- start:11023 stop:11298 length:276 start_codon:yes stop_codon:yes gene_type:complete
MMFNKLNITCDEATTICDKNQYGEASFFDKIKIQIHFLKCKICALYTKQNMLLTKAYKSKGASDKVKSSSLCMRQEDKEKLRKELEKLNTQ